MRYYGSNRRPSKNSLQHFKYIKREKVNGKWKYYYDADELKSDVSRAASNAADKVSDTARYVGNKVSNVASNAKKSVNKAVGVDAKRDYYQKSREANRINTYETRNVNSTAKVYTESGAASGKRIRDAKANLRNTEKQYDERLSREASADAERRKTLEDSYTTARDKRANAGLVSKAMFGKDMDKNVKDRNNALNAHDKNVSERRSRTEAERSTAVADAKKKVSDAEATDKFLGYSGGNKKRKIDTMVRTQNERRRQEQEAEKAYRKSLVGKIDTAGEAISKGAKNVAKKAGEVADNVSDAANDAKSWASQKVSDLGKSASKTVDKGKDFLDGLFGKRKKRR